MTDSNTIIFFNYSLKDVAKVRELYDKLKRAGFYPWIDIFDLLPEEKWESTVQKINAEVPIVMVCLSGPIRCERMNQIKCKESHVASKSEFGGKTHFIVVRLEECKVPYELHKYNCVDLYKYDGLKRLLQLIRKVLSQSRIAHGLRLRSQPDKALSYEEVHRMLVERDFFELNTHWGRGLLHQYEEIIQNGETLIYDYTTNLCWQKYGSIKYMSFGEGKQYVDELNRIEYAGRSDWRLPTIDEAMSLMEPNRNKSSLFIDDVFYDQPNIILTADLNPNSAVWIVYFNRGSCGRYGPPTAPVRAVRSLPSYMKKNSGNALSNYRRTKINVGPYYMKATKHLEMLMSGKESWKAWRETNPDIRPDLRNQNLKGKDLSGMNLMNSDFSGADLSECNLDKATLDGATLNHCNLSGALLRKARLAKALINEANLSRANLSGSICFKTDFDKASLADANFSSAEIREADMWGTNLENADLHNSIFWFSTMNNAILKNANIEGADLSWSTLVQVDFTNANLNNCIVHGVSAWDLNLTGAKQDNLRITSISQPKISADSIEIAQFIYLLLTNPKIRYVVDTVRSKVVLILGRFTKERIKVLESIKHYLRNYDCVPVLYDFDKPESQTTIETVSTIAHMAKFIIADLTDAKSVLQELQHIVPNIPSVPVKPLIIKDQKEPGMIDYFKMFRTFLEIYTYQSANELIQNIEKEVIRPTMNISDELQK